VERRLFKRRSALNAPQLNGINVASHDPDLINAIQKARMRLKYCQWPSGIIEATSTDDTPPHEAAVRLNSTFNCISALLLCATKQPLSR